MVPYPPCTLKGGPDGYPLACLWAGACVKKTDKCEAVERGEADDAMPVLP